jgi:hypothetical protein
MKVIRTCLSLLETGRKRCKPDARTRKAVFAVGWSLGILVNGKRFPNFSTIRPDEGQFSTANPLSMHRKER